MSKGGARSNTNRNKAESDLPASSIIVDEQGVVIGAPEDLTAEQQMIARGFAAEYVRDFNLYKSAIRIGCPPREAATTGKTIFDWSYTQRLIVEMVDELEESNIVTSKEVLIGLKQEAYHGDRSSDRIKAWSEIAKLLGMHVIKQEIDHKNTTPVINLTARKPDEYNYHQIEQQDGTSGNQ